MAQLAEGRAHALPAPAPPAIRPAWKPSGFLALLLPTPPRDAAEGLELFVDGARVAPPIARFDLPGCAFLLTHAPPGCAEGAELELRLGGRPIASAVLDAPGDELAVLREMGEAAQAAALRRFCGVAGIFRARTDARFAALCLRLATPLAAGRPAARALAADRLSLWQLPNQPRAAEGPWHLLAPGVVRQVAAPERGFLLIDGLWGSGAVLVPPSGLPVPLATPTEPLPDLLAAARAGGAARGALFDALARRGDGAALATLRDLQLLAPSRVEAVESPALPVGGALELALPDGEGGIFLRGWLRDPLGLVTGLALSGAGGCVPLPPPHRLPRPDLAEALRRAPQGDGGPSPGFVAHLPESRLHGAQFSLELTLASGRQLVLTAPPGLLPPEAARDLVLASVDPRSATDSLMAGCISPAVARLQRAAMRPGAAADRVVLGGTPPRRPVARIVVPLWRNLSFLRAQLAGFARDAAFRGATAPELVYVLDSPEQREEAVRLLGGLALLHGLAVTLLVHDRNRGYASACNTGAADAAAPLLVFLNSDVVAEAPGWLAPLRRRLARGRGVAAVGAKLLYPGGAIQHAGLFYAPTPEGGWGCNHFRKGWPGNDALASRAREVPAVTGAALAVHREAFGAVDGFCTDYVLGDFEDSDLCLKLRAAGGAVFYEPASVLTHHERQSIATHPGHAGTLAARHNRRLHEARWGEAIAALMHRPWQR